MSGDAATGLRLSGKLAVARAAMRLARATGLPFRDRAYRAWYDAISEFSEMLFADFFCMNYGCAPPSPSGGPEAYQLGLYDLLASWAPLADQRVLEVGSGRGGGAAHVHRVHRPQRVMGIDLSGLAVQASRAQFAAPGLRFEAGQAERLPFEDRSFDVLLNVESSHCYADLPGFLVEGRRVLTPGGSLLLADFRHREDAHEIGEQALAAGFKIDRELDISAQVLAALEADDPRKRALIDACPAVPGPVKGSIRHFAGCIGSPMYRDFQNGDRVYRAYRLVA